LISKEQEALSERELEILRLVATGASNQQIARELFISVNTVKVHLRNIFAKLGVNSRTEATIYAIKEGLIPVEGVPLLEGEGAIPAELQPPRAWPKWQLALTAAALVILLIVVLSRVMATPSASPGAIPTPAGAVASPLTRWTAMAPLPTPRAGSAVVAYEGRVYAIGGEAAEGITGIVERYDPEADSWASLAEKPVAVSDVAAAVIGGRIYVPGGRLASGEATDVMEVYDPERDIWERRAPLPVALSAYALAAFEGRLYLFGGWDGRSYSASVYEYDPTQDAWEAKTPMPTARGFAGAAVADGKIYVIGGYDGQEVLAVNEEYVPGRDDGRGNPWTARAPMPVGRAGAGIAVAANLIHVVGGWEEGAPDSFKYNVRTDSWQSFEAPIEGPWSNLGLALVDTRIYAIGGWDGDYMDANQAYQAIYTIILPVPGSR